MTHLSSQATTLGYLTTALEAANEVLQIKGTVSNQRVHKITEDSRAVNAQSLFVAVRGIKTDGHNFISAAVEKGARAVVCEQLPEEGSRLPGAVYVQVKCTRRALAVLADAFFKTPAKRLTVVGITGTNGKTTTASLVYHLLNSLGIKTGLIGTTGARIGDESVDLGLTTPGALEVNALFGQMAEAGCKVCVMEVSSHALDQFRLLSRQVDVGVFTNLSHDHLDYHGSFEAYKQAKKKLFDGLPSTGTAIYNADVSVGREMVQDTAAETISYGIDSPADQRGELINSTLTGLQMRVEGHRFQSGLTGRFNAYNLMAAYSAARVVTSRPIPELLDALAQAPPVAGRLERFSFADGTVVFVDYAHTPDALENVLRTLQESKPAGAKLWCVFGCGGDRDAGKRPMMGSVAERWADRLVLTSDNPRTEDPKLILKQIGQGVRAKNAVVVRSDRRKALQYAAQSAAAGDVVLVAGKGHETYQVQGTEKVPFDDREEVKRWFKRYSR